jgi:hypothetical protein
MLHMSVLRTTAVSCCSKILTGNLLYHNSIWVKRFFLSVGWMDDDIHHAQCSPSVLQVIPYGQQCMRSL